MKNLNLDLKKYDYLIKFEIITYMANSLDKNGGPLSHLGA